MPCSSDESAMGGPAEHPDHAPAGPGRPDFVRDRAYWDERYRSSSALWSGNPNPQLVSEAASLAPGVALDVGSGEGADAIWLAERGWRVTAVDVSTVALERGQAHAEQVSADAARRINWLHADVTEWAPAPRSYDLVSAQFLQMPAAQREPLYRRLAESVAPGGTLLIVGHDPSDLHSGVPRPPWPELYFTAGEIAAGLDPARWAIVISEARERAATGPDGQPATVRDAVLRARRLG